MDVAARAAVLRKLSPNAASVLDSATQEAQRRGQTVIGSEHLLWSLLATTVGKQSRGTIWLSSKVQPELVLGALEALPWFAKGSDGAGVDLLTTDTMGCDQMQTGSAEGIFATAAASANESFTSVSLDKILSYAAAVQQQIQEQGSTFEIATEYLLLACLLQDCVARAVVENASNVNGGTLVKALRLNEALFSEKLQQIRSSWTVPWRVVSVTASVIADTTLDAAGDGAARSQFDMVSMEDLRARDKEAIAKVTGPTMESNWVIPQIVCTGYVIPSRA
jgi:hypothetical protein